MSATVCIHHHGLTDATDQFGMDADALRSQLAAAIARVAGGDRAALRLVYQDTSAKLFGVCLRILRDRAEAEDVLQRLPHSLAAGPGQFRRKPREPDHLAGDDCPQPLLSTACWSQPAGTRRRAPIEDAHEVSDPRPDAAAVAGECAEQQAAAAGSCLRPVGRKAPPPSVPLFLDGATYEELANAQRDFPLGTMKSMDPPQPD